MANFIITGATGFIGSRLTKKLIAQGHNVNIISRVSSKYDNILEIKDKVNIFEYDGNINRLIEYFNKSNADVVVHLASLFIAENKAEDVENLIDSNVKFSTQILEAMKYSNCKKIINTSTSWQHYNNEYYNPVCLYAATKEAFENIIKFYCEAYEFKSITLELFDTYGAGDNRPKILNLLGEYSKKGIELNMSKGDQVLDLVYIDDVVDAYLKSINLIKNNSKGTFKKYSLESENRVSLKCLVDMYADITKNYVNINWGRRPYREREVMIPWSKGEKLPDWEPKITLQEGIKMAFAKDCMEGSND